MIEKLKAINPYDETEIDMDVNSVAGLVYENTPLVQKINKLVDAVNVLQAQVAILEEHAHPTAKTPDLPDGDDAIQEVIHADHYDWVGCLCELWSGNSKNHRYGILKGIAKNTYKGHKTIHKYQALSMSFEYCKPVKPDDDIIYKGDDND